METTQCRPSDLASCGELDRFKTLYFTQLYTVALTQEWYRFRDVTRDDFNGVDIMGRTPLHYATANSSTLAPTSYLLKMGADPTMVDICGFTPPHYAARCSNREALSFFLMEGADTGARGRDGMTALHCAGLIGNEEITKLLLEAGATVEAQDNCKRTLLHWAAASGIGAIMRALGASGASGSMRDNYGRIPVHIALLAGGQDGEYSEGLKKMLEKDGNKAWNAKVRDGCAALRLGAKAGNGMGIAVLLHQLVAIDIKVHDNHPDIDINPKDSRGQTPLSWAATNGHGPVVRLLLDQKDVDAD